MITFYADLFFCRPNCVVKNRNSFVWSRWQFGTQRQCSFHVQGNVQVRCWYACDGFKCWIYGMYGKQKTKMPYAKKGLEMCLFTEYYIIRITITVSIRHNQMDTMLEYTSNLYINFPFRINSITSKYSITAAFILGLYGYSDFLSTKHYDANND